MFLFANKDSAMYYSDVFAGVTVLYGTASGQIALLNEKVTMNFSTTIIY